MFTQIDKGYLYEPWQALGHQHLFCNAKASDHYLNDRSRLISEFGLKAFFTPKQKHTNHIFVPKTVADFDNLQNDYSDGIFIGDKKHFDKIGIGIYTADCLPILINSISSCAVIHAGWRGLANGILPQAIRLFNEPIEVLIGAAAGPQAYQVGSEVIENIGENASFTEDPQRGLFLDLAKTAQNQILSSTNQVNSLKILNICTITAKEFHSFRRDNTNARRNLSFLVCS